MLKVTTFPGGDATPLLLVHGLFGSARNLGPLARRLCTARTVHVVDLRNHGESPWFDHQTYADMAADLAEVITALSAPMAVYGHSMGGKAAMVLALTRPDLVQTLIVADIAPVAYDHSHRPLIAALQALDLGTLTSRGEADRLLAPEVPDAGTRAFLLQSLDLANRRWKLNLAVLDRDMDEITGWPQPPGHYDGPTLFLAGETSDYVRAQHWAQIRALFPTATALTIPAAGHWLHADQPEATAKAIAEFLHPAS